MKNIKSFPLCCFIALIVLAGARPVAAQGTAFTYQGRLNSGTSPVNGTYDLTFTLFSTNTTGIALAGPVTNSATGVTNGLFTTLVDFGPGAFTGTSNWLEIAVRTNGGASFATLAPRQQVTPTPYALMAGNASSVSGLTVVPNTVAGAPSLIGGSPDNFVSAGAIGATIGGGGATNVVVGPHNYHYTNSVTASFGTVAGGAANSAGAEATVSGGQNNNATGQYATVAGGYGNSASGAFSAVGGGEDNAASGDSSSGGATVGGGFLNAATANDSTVSGGYNNLATNFFATVPGGAGNLAGGQSSFAAGNNAQALNQGAFVWADSQASVFASTTTNQFSVRANGGVRFVTSGAGMTIDGVPVVTGSSYISVPGTLNFFAGQNAGNSGVTGAFNVGVGNLALSSLTYGSYNEASGSGALLADTSGGENAANGYSTMQYNTSGSYNTASGFQALYDNVSGNNNTALGVDAMFYNTNGSANTAVGGETLQYNLNGYNNVALGYQALYAEMNSVDNVGVGVATFYSLLNGGQNTAVGTYDFQNLTNGTGNVGLGYYAGNSLINGSDNIYIGNPGSATDNNVIRIGNGQSQVFLSGTLQGKPGIIGLNVDPSGLNIGNVNSNALTFGSNSGEGIASKRSGTNPYDLELWTDFAERLKVAQGGNVGIGTDSPGSLLDVAGTVTAKALTVNGTATVQVLTITGGSDVAEPFDLSSQNVPKGSVLVIDARHPGELKISQHAYDKCVAGIVSGANGVNPGLTLNQQSLSKAGRAVALTGRVYTLADATSAPIEPGDLLTTSDVAGHAMKVTDASKAQGAIIGKAMSALSNGRGYVLVLVSLQ